METCPLCHDHPAETIEAAGILIYLCPQAPPGQLVAFDPNRVHLEPEMFAW